MTFVTRTVHVRTVLPNATICVYQGSVAARSLGEVGKSMAVILQIVN